MKKIESISIQQLDNKKLAQNRLKSDILLSANLGFDDTLFKHPSRMDAFAAIFCVSGKAEVQINLKKYVLKSGTLALHVPENIIQINSCENLIVYPFIISSEFIQKIHFETKDLMNLYMAAKTSPVLDLQYEDIHILEKYYYLMESILQSETTYKDRMIIGVTSSFLYKIYDILIKKLKEKEYTRKIPERCEIVFEDFIKELNLFNGTKHSLSFFAQRLNLTPNYLSCRVKEYSGRTATEWIEESVILEAKTMLKHTNLTIQEIAYKLNFPTQTFFGKYFKRITGISPKQYRMS
ncbi:helix-turn-helix domain-containing protein [Bacteroides sp. ET489]|jgi:AraC-like DNA-binding protein|uniref:helix-turn-helix domain-containing protein n=1 Tax=Bacteroides sp. ET489 TaxID=3057126 RepID=UPI002671F376|nr:helix-turn-helix domain-containing protein [Bacteroides sp. ET489]MDO3392256.1 helix-turn-helix domain-containing protein [Bacteroides sp. ET489]